MLAQVECLAAQEVSTFRCSFVLPLSSAISQFRGGRASLSLPHHVGLNSAGLTFVLSLGGCAGKRQPISLMSLGGKRPFVYKTEFI